MKTRIFVCEDGRDRVLSCDISLDTYEILKKAAKNLNKPYTSLVREAWKKYGVSEEAILKYLSESPSETIRET